jgi:hypothetical protein
MSARSEDLTADLLHDLTEEQAQPASAPTAPKAPKAPAAATEPAPSAVVETRLFLAPSAWQRPRLARDGGSFSLSAGPLQVRLGRRSS